jgi:hypothetical protein
MAKSRSVKNSDISNWMVVVMLVAVILVSTFSIIMFLDAAEDAAPEVSGVGYGEVSLQIAPSSDPVPSAGSMDIETGEVSLVIE